MNHGPPTPLWYPGTPRGDLGTTTFVPNPTFPFLSGMKASDAQRETQTSDSAFSFLSRWIGSTQTPPGREAEQDTTPDLYSLISHGAPDASVTTSQLGNEEVDGAPVQFQPNNAPVSCTGLPASFCFLQAPTNLP